MLRVDLYTNCERLMQMLISITQNDSAVGVINAKETEKREKRWEALSFGQLIFLSVSPTFWIKKPK